jgi:hypothetical protein
LNSNYELHSIHQSGSCANLYAISEARNIVGYEQEVLVGIGNYLSGDILSSWSTSMLSVNDQMSSIKDIDSCDLYTQMKNLPLPYYIQTVHKSEFLIKKNNDLVKDSYGNLLTIEKYEDMCLHVIHQRFIFGILQEKKIGVIILELILASNRASLSKRFLKKFGLLCKQFQVNVVVDEIFTAGRTVNNGFLYCDSYCPDKFFEVISHVTLGKWLDAGIVLITAAFKKRVNEKIEKANLPSRTPTSEIDCAGPFSKWKQQQNVRTLIDTRRQQVLHSLKIDETDAWGVGCLIFSNHIVGRICSGLKMRLCPLLVDNMAIAKKANLKMTQNKKLSYIAVNEMIVVQVLDWLKCPSFDSIMDKIYYYSAKYWCRQGQADKNYKFNKFVEYMGKANISTDFNKNEREYKFFVDYVHGKANKHELIKQERKRERAPDDGKDKRARTWKVTENIKLDHDGMYKESDTYSIKVGDLTLDFTHSDKESSTHDSKERDTSSSSSSNSVEIIEVVDSDDEKQKKPAAVTTNRSTKTD